MEQGQVKRLPVIKDGKLIGIVSRRDLIRPLSAVIDQPATGQASDARILRLIQAELARQAWDPRHNITMVVSQGLVQLSGAVSGEEQLQALRVVIENTPGVREIRSKVIVLDPFLGTATVSPIDIRINGTGPACDSRKVST
jgi:predicted transcriptional regulator